MFRSTKRLIVLCGAVLFVAVSAYWGAVAYAEAQRRAEVEDTLKRLFSAEDPATRKGEFLELGLMASQDLSLVLSAIERTNSTFMFEPGELDLLLGAVVATEGQDWLVRECAEILLAEEVPGKTCALIALEKHGYYAPEILDVAMNVELPDFVRRRAILSLRSLEVPDAAAPDELALVLADPEESDNLKEACLETIAKLSPARVADLCADRIGDEQTSLRLFKRAAGLLVRQRHPEPLRSALTATETDVPRKCSAARSLLRLGLPEDIEAVGAEASTANAPAELTAAVLEEIGTRQLGGLEALVERSLSSDSKRLRMLGIRAAGAVNLTPGIEDSLVRNQEGASPEEIHAFDSAFPSDASR